MGVLGAKTVLQQLAKLMQAPNESKTCYKARNWNGITSPVCVLATPPQLKNSPPDNKKLNTAENVVSSASMSQNVLRELNCKPDQL